MSWQSTLHATVTAAAGAALLGAAVPATAGDRYHCPARDTPPRGGNGGNHSPAPAATVYPVPPANLRGQGLELEIAYSVPDAQPPNTSAQPVYVDIEEPDGTVRTFPLEGGSEVIPSREVTVHRGASMRIRFGGTTGK